MGLYLHEQFFYSANTNEEKPESGYGREETIAWDKESSMDYYLLTCCGREKREKYSQGIQPSTPMLTNESDCGPHRAIILEKDQSMTLPA